MNDWLGIITNVGLIVGLLLVAYEVNQTNLSMERDYDAWMTSTQFDAQQLFIDWGASISDRETAELWWNGINDQELDPIDEDRFYRLTKSYFWMYRTMSFAWNQIDGGGEGLALVLARQLHEQPGLRSRFMKWHGQEGGEFSGWVLESLERDLATR